jgi:hypothetical protein
LPDLSGSNWNDYTVVRTAKYVALVKKGSLTGKGIYFVEGVPAGGRVSA